MEVKLVRIIAGEMLKVYKLSVVRYIICFFIILQFFIFNDAHHFYTLEISDLQVNTKLVSILLLNTVVLASFIIIILSSMIAGIEYEKKMWGINLTKVSYMKLIFTKILTLCTICFLVSVFTFLFGCFCLKAYGYSITSLNLNVLLPQLFNITLISVFLGLITLLCSILFENSLAGIIVGLLITQVEPMIYQYSNSLAIFLPYWNIRGILSKTFDNLKINDYMIVIPDSYPSLFECMIILSVFLFIIIYYVYRKVNQEEFE